MNFGQLAETIGGVQQQDTYRWVDLDLRAGVDGGIWNELINLRLKVDGEYVFWKSRGGVQVAKTIAGNVLTAYPFKTRVGGALNQYIAMQTSMGNIELWNLTLDTVTQIMTGFPTTEKIQMINRGVFLYAFSFDGGIAKYYDLNTSTGFDYLNYDMGYITNANLTHDDIEKENLWGFEVGKTIIVFPNGETDVNGQFASYTAAITEIADGFIKWKNPDGVVETSRFGDPAITHELENEHIVFPYSSDLESLVGLPTNKKVAGSSVVANDKYVAPKIYRGYMVVDMLNDGSFTIPGRPFQLAATTDTLYQDGVTQVRFTVTSPGSNVVKRFLCATRWQDSPENAFVPSSASYANSRFFIVKEMEINRVFVDDRTPDSSLIRSIVEMLPMSGGVLDLFGSTQLKPNSIAGFTGSLLLAGYTVDRPIPKPYTNPSVATDENIFVNITPTTQLPNNMALAFQFEYTDGKRSNIVETEEFLQEGSTSESQPITCDQTKASATHTVTGGCTSDGTLTITYEGITVNVPLDTVNHSAPADVAEAIRQAVVGDATIRTTASVPISADIVYTEKRFGEEFNGLIVDADPSTTGVTFDTQDPTMSGAQESEGPPARGYITPVANNLNSGETNTLEFALDSVDSNSDGLVVTDGQSLASIAANVLTLVNDVPGFATDWTAFQDTRPSDGLDRVVIESKYPGNLSWNDIHFIIQSIGAKIIFEAEAPGKETMRSYQAFNTTGGAAPGCVQATASVDVSANSLAGSATEDHTITVDGNSTAPITIADTDTTEQIVDKYIAEIQSTPAIDIEWKSTKVDQGGGVWRLLLTYREYGTVGNSKVIDVAGEVDVSLTVNSPSSGGDDAGSAPVESADEVNANRVQIHSLNGLVSKVFIIGRTITTGTNYHLIQEVEISDPGAHGMVIGLPNSQEELDDIETDNFTSPTADEVLESIDLRNFVLIGTPFQQFNISGQKPTVDQSKILRAIPITFDVDKTLMRYKMAIFTEESIQFGYLTEAPSSVGQFFDADFEIIYNNIELKNRKGAALLKNIIPIQDNEGLYFLNVNGELSRLLDINRFSVLANNEIVDTVHHRDENEYWFVCKNNDIVVFDADTGAFSLMRLGASKTVFSATYGHNKLYIGMNNGLFEADVDGLVQDYPGEVAPDAIQCVATTSHLGSEESKTILKELLVAGQNNSVAVDVDLQQGRNETGGIVWSKTFNSDVNFNAKEIFMFGEAYQLNSHAKMPRVRLSFDAVANGLINSVRLKTNATMNTGKARE